MKYFFNEKGLIIKFSFREKLIIFIKGFIKLNYYDSYKHSSFLLKLVSDAVAKYGDGNVHGTVKEDEK
jgi:hypothetical protein